MEIKEIIDNLDNFSKRDLVRLYLCVNEKYQALKQENPNCIRNTMWAVKNFEKAKDCLNRSRQKARENKQNES